jgi:SagB-type dehydrogenase family enzyme
LRPPTTKKKQKAGRVILSARLNSYVELDVRADGTIAAAIDGDAISLGKLSASAAKRAQDLKSGLPLDSFAAEDPDIGEEIERLVRRLATHGLLEFPLGRSRDDDEVIIEPQIPNYWPRMPQLDDADMLALSRFAYMRRRGNDLILESPLAGALFRISDPKKVAGALALLSTPQPMKELRQQDDFPGHELLALLVDCRIVFMIDSARGDGLRTGEGDDNLVLWDFHDLLFHARSTLGRHDNPVGGLCPYAGLIAPLPAVRPAWPGRKIELGNILPVGSEEISAVTKVLRNRHSTRIFDDQRPITLSELARLLENVARVRARWESTLDFGDGGPVVSFASRPYPSGGASYPLELYLAVSKCDGLASGFYHYDADIHALVLIDARKEELEAHVAGAAFAMGSHAAPQILITIAARFGRVSWKYSSIAYALILKDVGVLMQTLYVVLTDLGLGGCAIGTTDISRFANMTGLEFHVEGPVGQFALGRGLPQAGD